jgi:uridylate kinase
MTQTQTTNGTHYKPAYQRILLKLSGEALAGDLGFGIDADRAHFIAEKVKQLHGLGVQIAVVIGGGNLWRGATGEKMGMDRTTADHIGLLGTIMNALALRDALESLRVPTRVQTAIDVNTVAEPYIRLRAMRHMEKGYVVIFAGGTGNPYFTTDTAAALRAAEINAEIIIKATKVNGVYTADPKKDPTATRFEQLMFDQVINSKLEVMDLTAITMCQQNNVPILVLNFWNDDDLFHAVLGQTDVGTLIK